MEKTNFVHSYKEFSADAIRRRINQMLEFRAGVDVSAARVKFSYGNRKTGALVPSVSLIPVADCGNCKSCAAGCYDVKNVCYLPAVQKSRAINSAIYAADPERYFDEILAAVKFLRFFRWHVGGDLKDEYYLSKVVEIAAAVPGCEFLIFTKMFNLVNSWISKNGALPKNLHLIFSDWRGQDMKNPYNLPVSSPVWFDKDGAEIERGPHCSGRVTWCPGFCEDCAACGGGCWGAGAGDTILFEAH